jgi:hypothetical protein
MIKKITFLSLACLLSSGIINAKEPVVNGSHRGPTPSNEVLAGCANSTAITSLDINNVRTIIMMNGDMWWDAIAQGVARYEIPKGSGKTSLFAGAIWIGALDPGNNLRVSAQTYRQGALGGNDFWPGPLDVSADVNPSTCLAFDKHFKVTREQVSAFIADYSASGANIDLSNYPEIKDWPGNAPAITGFPSTTVMAPYYENPDPNRPASAIGQYHPEYGDFPMYYYESLPSGGAGFYPTNPNMDPCSKDLLLGDQTLWWVFNDVGNTHTESQGVPLGMEIQAQAFAFVTNDDINNMTFYRYKIINRSTTPYHDTYFGAWCDPDLGNANDDFVGCDVKRSLGYCYNADDVDESAQGYGANPPASGIDFFEGPIADIGDNEDNDRDSCVDCTNFTEANGDVIHISDDDLTWTKNNDTTVNAGPYVSSQGDTLSGRESIVMSSFVYYNNTPPVAGMGDPNLAQEYYNYLTNKWKDNTTFKFGGNGYAPVACPPTAAGTLTRFMFPGDTDPYGWGTNGVITKTGNPTCYNWSEDNASNGNPNVGADRRFMQGAGPFTLTPGAVNFITTGAVWAKATSGGRLASVSLLRRADDYAQGLFDHCFKVTNGPDAPDLSIRENSKQLIITLTNDNVISNNFRETYTEVDPNILTTSFFRFEGYRVYQLKDATVTAQDLCNLDRAREIAHYDIKNGVDIITNYIIGTVPCSNISPAGSNWNAYLAIDDNLPNTPLDNGIRHSFVFNTDAFTSQPLINHKTYYFMAIAYAFNPDEVPPLDPYTTPVGKNAPYLSGRNNVKTYAAVPHQISIEMGGTIANSIVGDIPEITRIEGGGNGNAANALEFKSGDGVHPDGEEQLKFPPVDLSRPPYIQYPTYVRGKGPVDIKVYDPIKVSGGEFEIWTTDTAKTGQWVLRNLNTGRVDSSHKTLEAPYEQIFTNYGFYINMFQTLNALGYPKQPGDSIPGQIDGGFIEANKVNKGTNWLSGVADVDPVAAPVGTEALYDWIASGVADAGTDYSYLWGSTTSAAISPNKDLDEVWESLLGGTWAPYRFTRSSNSIYVSSPAFAVSQPQTRDIQERIQSSVDIVFTGDKSLWTKCPVIEMQFDSMKAIGRAAKNRLRRSPSLDINFVPSTTDSGFSYFPGYAINIETGERLNMAFGEDSYIRTDTNFTTNLGGDMIWNPDFHDTLTDPWNPGIPYYSLGGKHVIFVFAKVDTFIAKPTLPSTSWDTMYMAGYDEGATLAAYFRKTGTSTVVTRALREAWATCAWVGYTKLANNVSEVPLYSGSTANDVRVRIRVEKPYQYFSTGTPPSPYVNVNGMPHYKFSTTNFAVSTGNLEVAKNALDSINVVPNPYYAYSDYDKKAFDNRVKIVNLPANCKVSVYTTNGTLIRTLYRDVSNLSEGTSVGGDISKPLTFDTTIDWDLRNERGVPVSSGIYLIHIEAPGLGERTLKWFGVMRPIDLDTF